MRKIILTTFLLIALSFTTHKAHATVPVFDYGNFGENVLQYVQMGLDYSSQVIQEAANSNSSLMDTINNTNEYVIKPMNDVLILRTVISSKEQMQALVSGKMGGEDPLLIANPEQYLQNKANGVTQQAIGSLVEQEGPYSESVMAELIKKARYSNMPLDDKLKAINQSEIPAMEQKRRCTDEALSAQADADVKNSGQSYTQEAYIARKKELNDALCGDINDPNTRAALVTMNNQDPSLDGFLALTAGCENEFCRSRLAMNEIEARRNAVTQAAEKDRELGGGLRSATTCNKRVTTKINGQKYTEGDLSAPCVSETITQTSNSINESFKDSFDTIKPQLSLIGNDAKGIMGTVAAALTTISLTEQLGKQLGVGGGSNGGGNSGGYTNDLLNNQQGKINLTKTPLEYLSGQKSSLTELSSWEIKHLDSINTERLDMDSMIACYENVVKTYPKEGQNPAPELLAAREFYTSYYQTEINGPSSTKGKVLAEQEFVQTENTLIDQTVSKINNSNSTEEILSIFQGFQDTVKSQGLPEAITASAARKGEYYRHDGLLRQSLAQGGKIYQMNETCTKYTTDARDRNNGCYGGSCVP